MRGDCGFIFDMLKNNKIAKNAAWIISCRIVQALLSFVIGILCARYLGPSNYGVINYAASITAFMIPVIQLGLRSTLVHELIAAPEREGEIIGTTICMSAAASLLGILGVAAFTSIANRNQPETIIVCTLYSISLLFQAVEMIEYWFQAKLLSKYTAVTSLIAYTAVSLYRVFLLVTKKNVFWFALSQSLDYLIIAALLILIYDRLNGQKFRFSLNTARELFSRSRYYIVSGIMVTFFSLSDRIMITLMIGNEANGYYAAAMTCADISRFVFAAIVDSARPAIFEERKNSLSEYHVKIARTFAIIIYLGVAQSIFFVLFSGVAINILYGADFYPAIKTLKIITWYTAFAYIGSVRNIWILAEQKQQMLWKINLSGALLNIAANYMMIPIWGIDGAAVASVIAQAFTNFVLCLILKPLRPVAHLIFVGINPKNQKKLWAKSGRKIL